MRRRSVAQDDPAVRTETTPAERVALALALGRRDVAIYAHAAGIDPRAARLAVERRRQARRRRSASMEALLG